MATLILQNTYRALEEELKSIDKLRTATALKIKEAASHGDHKENYENKAAKEEMEFVVNKKQLLQSYAPFRFIEYGENKTDEAGFGNKVTIREEDWEEILQAVGQQQQQQGPQQGGPPQQQGKPQQGGEGQVPPDQLQQVLQQLPTEVKAQVAQAIDSGMPPQQALQAAMQQMQQQPPMQ